MGPKTANVFVALSGGVDSSAAAALLHQRGLNCTAVFMITSDRLLNTQTNAEKVADKLGIKLHVLDLREDFEHVLDYFCSEYKNGRTPNPCVFCNRYIKFGKLWDFAQANGAQMFATGHYAKILKNNNDTGLYEADNADNDQSYVLAMIDSNTLPCLILPMAEYSKQQTRQIAAKFGLETKDCLPSQEICFIPNDNYVAAVEDRCPQLIRRGNIVDSNGTILGRHNGVHRFTIGQRRGTQVAMGKPYYVVRINAQTNTVTLGPKEEVMHRKLTATEVNWLTQKPLSAFRAKVKIRYNDKGAAATVTPDADGAVVEFDEPIAAITPGQLAAFYVQKRHNSRLIGGGWIDKWQD